MDFHEQLGEQTREARDYLLAAPAIHRAMAGEVTAGLYRAFLGQAYHHVRQTVPLLMAVGSRLGDDKDWLRSEIVHYVQGEHGHEQRVLDDIEAAGGDRLAAAAAAAAPHVETDAMVAYAWDAAMRRNPVGVFGMVFVLEGTSAALALQAANRVQTDLALPDRAFSYLRSHGTLDREHIEHLGGILRRLEAPAGRAAVVDRARAMFSPYGDVFRSLERA